MWDKFGEFDSAEELNRAAAAQKAEGDREALIMLAEENGIDRDDAEDYLDGAVDELATPLMAAVGKLQVEAAALGLGGALVLGAAWLFGRAEREAASLGIIGGADGPTVIYVTGPHRPLWLWLMLGAGIVLALAGAVGLWKRRKGR